MKRIVFGILLICHTGCDLFWGESPEPGNVKSCGDGYRNSLTFFNNKTYTAQTAIGRFHFNNMYDFNRQQKLRIDTFLIQMRDSASGTVTIYSADTAIVREWKLDVPIADTCSTNLSFPVYEPSTHAYVNFTFSSFPSDRSGNYYEALDFQTQEIWINYSSENLGHCFLRLRSVPQ
jgi:Uncharacterized protein conserved in bacteria